MNTNILENVKVELEKKGYKVTIHTIITENRKSSILHEDEKILTIKDIANNKEYIIETTGEIRILDINGELVFDGKERGEGLGMDIDKITDNYLLELIEKGYIFDENWYSMYEMSDKQNDIEVDSDFNIKDLIENINWFNSNN